MNVQYETIREITKSAIEHGVISVMNYSYESEEEYEKQNDFNTKQIVDFMTKIAHALNDLREDKI